MSRIPPVPAARLQGCTAGYPVERDPRGRHLSRAMRLHVDGDSTLGLEPAVLWSDSIVGLALGAVFLVPQSRGA